MVWTRLERLGRARLGEDRGLVWYGTVRLGMAGQGSRILIAEQGLVGSGMVRFGTARQGKDRGSD
jgi:hypothetical protein